MRTSTPNHRAVPLASAALATLAMLAVAACVADDSGPGGSGGAPAGSDATSTGAVDDVTLPLDAYVLTPEQQGQRDVAMWVLTGECMGRAGYIEMDNTSEYRRMAENATRSRISQGGVTGNKGRYGLADPVAAGTYGYGPAPLETDPVPQWLDKSRFTAAKAQAFNGCQLKAAQAVLGEVEVLGATSGNGPSAIALDPGGAEDPAAVDPITAVTKGYALHEDPAVRAADAGWSACMQEKGYSYATSIEVQNFFTGGSSTDTASPEEIATAKADVACKESTGYVGALVDAEARLQTALIEQHFEELQEYRAANDAMLRRVADVLAGT